MRDIPVVESERLVLRAMTDDDLDDYARMLADERIYRWFGGEEPTREEAWRSMAMHLGHWVLRGYGQWLLEHRGSGSFVGRAGLWQPEGWPGLEVGWAVAPEHWGQGYATEAGKAAVSWAFAELDADEVISVTLPHNTASRRVMEKVGLAYDRSERVAGSDQVIYRTTPAAWSADG